MVSGLQSRTLPGMRQRRVASSGFQTKESMAKKKGRSRVETTAWGDVRLLGLQNRTLQKPYTSRSINRECYAIPAAAAQADPSAVAVEPRGKLEPSGDPDGTQGVEEDFGHQGE